MLLQDIKTIKLQNKAAKILNLSVAYDRTFVIVRVDKPCQVESIVHLDSNGKQLWSYKYNDTIDIFGQMNLKQVIVLNVPLNKIDIINLQTHSVLSISHQFIFQCSVHMKIYNFAESRTFCIQEKGSFGDNHLKLSYYQYENLKENSQPLAVYESKQNQWTYNQLIFKGNNHSKIIWFRNKHQGQITFSYYMLQPNSQGKVLGCFSIGKAVNTLGNFYGIADFEINIQGIWQTNKNTYLIWTLHTYDYVDKISKNNMKNTFILSFEMGNDSGVLRESKFEFDKINENSSWSRNLINCFGVSNLSVFPTFQYKNGQPVESPLYYINNLCQQIVHKQSWICSCLSQNYYFPGWDGNTFIQSEYQNGDVQQIRVKVNKLCNPKQISLHFLLSLNQDFDDDLLQDTIQLLHYE